jgi:hypothetical protein
MGLALLIAGVALQASNGAKQRANSKRGQLRQPDLARFYGKKAADLRAGLYDFRIKLIRPALSGPERITMINRKSTSLNWSDEGDTLSGSLTLRRPWRLKPGSAPINKGDGIRLEVKWAGKWKELWTLWVQGDPPVTLLSGEVSVELGDELFPLKKNERDWEFKQTKRGPRHKGWTADEVARFVGKSERIRIGKLAQGPERFEIKKMKKASGLEVIRRAYAEESKRTGRKFIVRMRGGRLDVEALQRPGTMYVIHGIEREASTAGASKQDHPATVIEARGRLRGKSGKDGKLKVTVAREKAVRRFGRVVKEKDYGRVDSKDDLRTQAKRDLAAELKVTRTATLELPGIPFLEKGSTLRWVIGEPGWHGKTTLAKHGRDKGICFVTSAQHSLTPEGYTTTVSVNQDDVFLDEARRLDEEDRDKKRQERDARKGSGK